MVELLLHCCQDCQRCDPELQKLVAEIASVSDKVFDLNQGAAKDQRISTQGECISQLRTAMALQQEQHQRAMEQMAVQLEQQQQMMNHQQEQQQRLLDKVVEVSAKVEAPDTPHMTPRGDPTGPEPNPPFTTIIMTQKTETTTTSVISTTTGGSADSKTASSALPSGLNSNMGLVPDDEVVVPQEP